MGNRSYMTKNNIKSQKMYSELATRVVRTHASTDPKVNCWMIFMLKVSELPSSLCLSHTAPTEVQMHRKSVTHWTLLDVFTLHFTLIRTYLKGKLMMHSILAHATMQNSLN